MINPVQIQKYLKGVNYPADKNEIIQKAKENNAPQDVVDLLENVTEKTYNKPTELVSEMSQKELV